MNTIESRYAALEVELRLRLTSPGILKGKQRGQTFIDKVVSLALRLFRSHGLSKYEHTFPIARAAFSAMAGICQWTIRRAIPILIKIDFVGQVGQTVRRCHNGTKSTTDGSKSCWFFPGQFRLAVWAQEWLHKEVVRLPENHKALDDTQNDRRKEGSKEEGINLDLNIQGSLEDEEYVADAFPSRIAQEAPWRPLRKSWEPSPEDVLEAIREESSKPLGLKLSSAALSIFKRGRMW